MASSARVAAEREPKIDVGGAVARALGKKLSALIAEAERARARIERIAEMKQAPPRLAMEIPAVSDR